MVLPSAWRAIYHNVKALGYGGTHPYHEEGNLAVNCCTGELRPVVFKIEKL
ncbi:TIGR04076 family protein [Candidatus Bathyarchaeota archaeon]|nr:TIGR04076 family protein [Candidatus Bathyarchaeota archaeon]